MNDPLPEGHMASYIERRKFLATLGGAVTAWPLAARAQQRAAVARIGYLTPRSAISPSRPFRPGYMKSRRQPFLDGSVIENRFACLRTERLPALAADCVRLNVDSIVTAATPAAKAAQ